ncbi:MAG: ATP-binding cassette domain-containing protein [Tenericutes bacterium]|nr:ATP-binding cassette domain-containing protein [Mycoplasmatota bacterium]
MKLELININKSFSNKKILKDISFTINSGKAMGFLGRNGAGKTTTIRIIMDVFKADSGSITINDKPFLKKDYKIGYLPEEKGMYQKIPLLKQLVYFGELKGLSKKEAIEKGTEIINKMGLSEYLNKPLSMLSKGNQQKFFIAQSIINDPDILILDEPFGGLDPVNAQSLKDIIRDYIKKDKIVIFSSHQMSHVEEFCDDVTFIKDGKIVLSDNLNKLKKEMGKNKIKIKLIEDNEVEKLNIIKDILIKKENDYIIIECLNNKKTNDLLLEILNLKLNIEEFSNYVPNLETIFIKIEGDKNE